MGAPQAQGAPEQTQHTSGQARPQGCGSSKVLSQLSDAPAVRSNERPEREQNNGSISGLATEPVGAKPRVLGKVLSKQLASLYRKELKQGFYLKWRGKGVPSEEVTLTVALIEYRRGRLEAYHSKRGAG